MSANITPATTAATVQSLDRAPDCQMLDIGAIKQLTGKSRATIYRWIEAGTLPQPRKIGVSRNFWTVGEIRHALGLKRAAA